MIFEIIYNWLWKLVVRGLYLRPQILLMGARSSVVEQHPFKVKVGGSSPPVLTKNPI